MAQDVRSETPAEPIVLGVSEEFESIVSEHEVVIVDFYADWCGPCRMMEPAVEAIAAETDAAVLKVDIDRHGRLAAAHNIRGVPTTKVYADSEEVDQMVGLQTEEQLRAAVDRHRPV